MSKRLRQAAYKVEEPGLPQLGTEQLGMEELQENQGGHRLRARETRNDQLDGISRKLKFSKVLPFNKLHKSDHQTEIGYFSEEDDLNTKGSRIGEDQDESQSKGEARMSHVVILVKSADDAAMN